MRPHSSYSREFAKSDISVTNVLPTSVAERRLFIRCPMWRLEFAEELVEEPAAGALPLFQEAYR